MTAAVMPAGSLFLRSVSEGSTELAPSKGGKLRGISAASTAVPEEGQDSSKNGLTSGAYPTASFANCHLICPAAPKWCKSISTEAQQLKESLPRADVVPRADLASGAYPMATFPNSHLAAPAAAKWCRPLTVQQQLYKAIQDEDWKGHYMLGRTKAKLQPAWTASAERCATLQRLVDYNHSRRVLEVGSFCGASSLALAEALPEGGEVRAVEKESVAVNLGKMYQSKSAAGSKIKTSVCDAKAWLDELANEKHDSFDLVLIDADKDNMKDYVDTVLHAPGLLAPQSLICVDITETCQRELEELRKTVADQKRQIAFELQGLLVF